MEKSEALNQLCKMQGEIAERLGLDTQCICEEPQGKPKGGGVPDEVISELWRLIADGYLYRHLREIIHQKERKSDGSGLDGRPVRLLNISKGTLNVLMRNDIHTFGDLLRCSGVGLLRNKRLIGRKRLREINGALGELDLSLREPFPDEFRK